MQASFDQPEPAAEGPGKAADGLPIIPSDYTVTSRPRRTTAQSDIKETILRPGPVRINVQGAFIVDEEPVTPRSEDYEHDPRDIRLPNHTAVVSHIAVDVSFFIPLAMRHATSCHSWLPHHTDRLSKQANRKNH